MSDGDLVSDLLSGEYRALARTITKIENRSAGYRELVADLRGQILREWFIVGTSQLWLPQAESPL